MWQVLVMVGAVVYLGILVWSLIAFFDAGVRDWFQEYISGAGALLAIVMWPATAAIAAVLFFAGTYSSRIVKPYRLAAVRDPRKLVTTAGDISDQVIGREEFCAALISSVDRSSARGRTDAAGGRSRTHVVVGRMGAGKTALLVLLTQRLAEMWAVPVPVRLRDAKEQINFCELAYTRFVEAVSTKMAAKSEAEKAWRWLLQRRQVVVLADGLEEALLDGAREAERDALIRKAIADANDQGLPVIITSRPHDPLRGMDATISELEPLNEEASLKYVSSTGGWSANERLVDQLVQTADFADAPLYLQLARQLHSAELFEQGLAGNAGADRACLRLSLFDTWVENLIRGRLQAHVSLSPSERRAAIDYLSALALVGLGHDSSEVSFAALLGGCQDGEPATRNSDSAAAPQNGTDESRAAVCPYPGIIGEVRTRLQRDNVYCDAFIAARWGQKMGLVEANGDGVRFRHSLMQAYLGARFMGTVLRRDEPPPPAERNGVTAGVTRLTSVLRRRASAPTGGMFLPTALRKPGHELLSALVLYSRSPDGRCTHADGGPDGGWCPTAVARDLLLTAAERATEAPPDDGQAETTKDIEARVLELPLGGARALDLYAAAVDVDTAERDSVLGDIAETVRDKWASLQDRDPEAYKSAKNAFLRRLAAAVRRRTAEAAHQDGADRKVARDLAARVYQAMFDIVGKEPSYRTRVVATLEMGLGGREAFRALENHFVPPAGGAPPPHEEAWRRETLTATLLPLLVVSASGDTRGENSPLRHLERWLARVGHDSRDGAARLPLSSEIALAQGFKFAANRRHQHPFGKGPHAELADHALQMLRTTRFWYTRLTLLQARTLWELPDDVNTPKATTGLVADPKAKIRGWLEAADGTEEQHPFVRATADLAVKALLTREPERYLWMDESIVVGHIGSRSTEQGKPRKHNLWIPYSIGWSALVPVAQQLVADVLLLLNLTEQGDHPGKRLELLERTGNTGQHLPPCLARDPSEFEPGASHTEPPKHCGCPFDLCPYPARNRQSTRIEFGDIFCQRQMDLIRPGRRPRASRRAPWQRGVEAGALLRFWAEMKQRTRERSADDPPEAVHRAHLRRPFHNGGP
ncbi:MAG TPA: NACHT domain-containing protein [Yinghuangia sp.]|nr:NACHT domain-containing protein [Yinghuangia sp.]